MRSVISGLGVAVMACLVAIPAPPARAATNPLDAGPIADFFNEFRQQAIPRGDGMSGPLPASLVAHGCASNRSSPPKAERPSSAASSRGRGVRVSEPAYGVAGPLRHVVRRARIIQAPTSPNART